MKSDELKKLAQDFLLAIQYHHHPSYLFESGFKAALKYINDAAQCIDDTESRKYIQSICKIEEC